MFVETLAERVIKPFNNLENDFNKKSNYLL